MPFSGNCKYLHALTEGPPEEVERFLGFLMQVDVVPQQLDEDVLTILRQRRQGELQ